MNNLFNPGDAVKLKASNLLMMVKGIDSPYQEPDTTAKEKYQCVWYDNGAELHEAVFTKDMLEWLAPYNDMLHFSNYE